MGLSDSDIYNGLRHPEYLKKSFRVEGNYTTEEALIQMYTKLRPGEPATVNGGQQILYSRFFDPKRYDLGKVGRYKINKKLSLSIPENIKVLTPQDTLSAIDYLINLKFNIGEIDDIDHLGNRRVRSVGELLQNQVRVGLTRLERIIRERMTICDLNTLTPNTLVNPKPIIAQIHGFCIAGGLATATFCDLRICSEDAKFGAPEIRTGGPYIPAIWPWVIGMTKARELLYTGNLIDAAEAKRLDEAYRSGEF